MPRDYKICPYHNNVAEPSEAYPQGYVECKLLTQTTGWYALITNGICEQCAHFGKAELANPRIQQLLRTLKRARIRDPQSPHYPEARTVEAVAHEVLAERRMTKTELMRDLEKSVERGLGPERADAIAVTEGLGEGVEITDLGRP